MRDDINPNQFQGVLREEWKTVQQRLAQETKSLSTYPDSNPDILDDSVKMMAQDQSPLKIKSIIWTENKISVELDRETIRSRPEYDPEKSIK